MEERLEDKIFANILDALKIKLTKERYTEAQFSHECTMCREKFEKGYKVKPEYVTGDDTPYLFICDECYEDLTND